MPAKHSILKTIAVASFAFFTVAGTSLLSGSPAREAPFDYHTHLAVPAHLPEDDWTGGPRECDVLAGITTSCIFPD